MNQWSRDNQNRITKLNFGWTGSSGVHTFGRLQCSGRTVLNGKFSGGFSRSKDRNKWNSVFCDMDKFVNDSGAALHHFLWCLFLTLLAAVDRRRGCQIAASAFLCSTIQPKKPGCHGPSTPHGEPDPWGSVDAVLNSWGWQSGVFAKWSREKVRKKFSFRWKAGYALFAVLFACLFSVRPLAARITGRTKKPNRCLSIRRMPISQPFEM